MKRTTEGSRTTITFREKVSDFRLKTGVEFVRSYGEPYVSITQESANPDGGEPDCIVMTEKQFFRIAAAVKS